MFAFIYGALSGPQQRCQPVAKVKAVGICSLMGFYHARHALFPDEYIKIITVQTEFLITDLLAIVLCFL